MKTGTNIFTAILFIFLLNSCCVNVHCDVCWPDALTVNVFDESTEDPLEDFYIEVRRGESLLLDEQNVAGSSITVDIISFTEYEITVSKDGYQTVTTQAQVNMKDCDFDECCCCETTGNVVDIYLEPSS